MIDPAERIQELQKLIVELLEHVGERSICRGCGTAIYFLTHRNGRVTPYTLHGQNHFIDCPNAKQFRKGGSRA